jgi:GxxExxY protein
MCCDMHVDPAMFNDLTGGILGAAIEVHRHLGPGLLESIYAECLHYELGVRGLRFVAQQPISIVYKELKLPACYRVDLIVEDAIVVEVKSAAAITPVFKSQLLTYLHLTRCPAGLLINFNSARLMDGVTRVLNPRASDA